MAGGHIIHKSFNSTIENPLTEDVNHRIMKRGTAYDLDG